MIVSVLDIQAGFFSLFFFLLNHYLYAKENNIPFRIKSDKWMFKYKLGWLDYFTSSLIYDENCQDAQLKFHNQVFKNYCLDDYITAIKEIYTLNDLMKEKIELKIQELPKKYASIFIRRGAKLMSESRLILSNQYLQKLLELDPTVTDVFVQTDDYTAVEEIRHLISSNDLSINVHTLCPPEMRGEFVSCYLNNYVSNVSYLNNQYLQFIKQKTQVKALDHFTPEEMKEHTERMLIGIDICLRSSICILDYQSNVSRFIKLAHPTPDCVHCVINDKKLFFDKIYECPAYDGFKEIQ